MQVFKIWKCVVMVCWYSNQFSGQYPSSQSVFETTFWGLDADRVQSLKRSIKWKLRRSTLSTKSIIWCRYFETDWLTDCVAWVPNRGSLERKIRTVTLRVNVFCLTSFTPLHYFVLHKLHAMVIETPLTWPFIMFWWRKVGNNSRKHNCSLLDT
jgi:hypothetical protein